MKYTAEEVRAIAKRLHDDITVADGDALMASDMLTAYADMIERAQAGVTDELVRSVDIQPASPAGVPEGWVLVPREPTTAILEALESTQQNTEAGSLYNSVDCWEAMLAAATQPGESA